MFDKDLIDSLDTESRAQEMKFGMWLTAPAFVFIIIPAACLFAYSRSTGYDEYPLVMHLLHEYHVALFIPLIIICATLSAALYLILVKDVIRFAQQRRRSELMHQVYPDTAPEMPEGQQRAIAGFVAFALVILTTGMLFWNG